MIDRLMDDRQTDDTFIKMWGEREKRGRGEEGKQEGRRQQLAASGPWPEFVHMTPSELHTVRGRGGRKPGGWEGRGCGTTSTRWPHWTAPRVFQRPGAIHGLSPGCNEAAGCAVPQGVCVSAVGPSGAGRRAAEFWGGHAHLPTRLPCACTRRTPGCTRLTESNGTVRADRAPGPVW